MRLSVLLENIGPFPIYGTGVDKVSERKGSGGVEEVGYCKVALCYRVPETTVDAIHGRGCARECESGESKEWGRGGKKSGICAHIHTQKDEESGGEERRGVERRWRSVIEVKTMMKETKRRRPSSPSFILITCRVSVVQQRLVVSKYARGRPKTSYINRLMACTPFLLSIIPHSPCLLCFILAFISQSGRVSAREGA
jgi:hypothetical protein